MTSFRFRKRTEYALMVMAQIAKANGQLVSVQSLKEKDMPRSYLVRIAKNLINAKLIKAKEGRGGGYILDKDPNSVTIQDIVDAVDGNITDKCPDEKLLGPYMDEVSEMLSKHKLNELMI